MLLCTPFNPCLREEGAASAAAPTAKKKKDQLEGVDDQDLIVKLHCYFAHFSLLLPFLFAYMVLFEEIYEDFTFFFFGFSMISMSFQRVFKGFKLKLSFGQHFTSLYFETDLK